MPHTSLFHQVWFREFSGLGNPGCCGEEVKGGSEEQPLRIGTTQRVAVVLCRANRITNYDSTDASVTTFAFPEEQKDRTCVQDG